MPFHRQAVPVMACAMVRAVPLNGHAVPCHIIHAMACQGRPWHAMEGHGMAWHAMACHGHATAWHPMPYHSLQCHSMPCPGQGHHLCQMADVV